VDEQLGRGVERLDLRGSPDARWRRDLVRGAERRRRVTGRPRDAESEIDGADGEREQGPRVGSVAEVDEWAPGALLREKVMEDCQAVGQAPERRRDLDLRGTRRDTPERRQRPADVR